MLKLFKRKNEINELRQAIEQQVEAIEELRKQVESMAETYNALKSHTQVERQTTEYQRKRKWLGGMPDESESVSPFVSGGKKA